MEIEPTEDGVDIGNRDRSDEVPRKNRRSRLASNLYDEQVQLLERLQALEEGLSDRVKESDLLMRRMEAARMLMDEIATQLRDDEFETCGRRRFRGGRSA